ncbi:MAG: hypothetical protein A2735_01130 [Candidatus Yanofskybacteria bacterium RIFCSPHIGHO2_01_FULL_41_21]|uniref:Baseplate protein J-like domain-containing protein n=1 Tax=Candidatus Yanofskybacteria bacterium RIFCSPHIGHO2_01_FULL_41_21 TaxID=1802660 RepID=A0A1F8EA02_9BACT|nr:MAG: hypothetical protein A2735_01130 [Candidatus Yanofskybacteria bacterium RIFCSPHIGHO2_01_FULL_41_21]
MSSTKIINVLKDDSFQEILDLFKGTSAEEVIFVLPKSARAFKKEEHFASLRDESKSLGKAVSFLCSSPEVNDFAKKYKFDVLLARSSAPRKSVSQRTSASHQVPKEMGSINVVNQIEDFYAEPATSNDSISTTLTSEESSDDLDFEDSTNNRRLDDVFVPEVENRHNVKVSGAREKAIPIEVNQNGPEYEPLEHRALEEIKSVWGSQPISPKINDRPRRPVHRIGLIVMSFVAIIVLGVAVFITTGKAQIIIKPASQPLDLKLTVLASDNISAVSLTGMAIPGQLFNIQKTVSQDFTATGHVDVAQKARGTITVYNELSVDQPLVATTRFESADNHIFHTLTSIVVPAGKTSNGKFIPGKKDVQIIADKAGSEYNVPVGSFTIPAFKEQGATEKYQKVYGQLTTPILNGTSGQSTVVTETDLNSAKQTLTEQLTTNIQDELKAQIDGLKIINNSQVTIDSPVSTSLADAKATTFKVNLSGSLKTVGFKESDLYSLISQYVDTQKNLTILPDKLTLSYGDINWDENKKSLSFTINITGPGYTKIDSEKIISELLGKNDTDMKAYLGAISGISSANVSLSPFWVRSIPNNKDKVRVDVSY